MTTSPITEEIIRRIEALPQTQQKLVLDFVASLARPAGRPGRELLHLAGTIEPHDLETMRQVADEECEQIDSHEW
jgi:hypothetical protein